MTGFTAEPRSGTGLRGVEDAAQSFSPSGRSGAPRAGAERPGGARWR